MKYEVTNEQGRLSANVYLKSSKIDMAQRMKEVLQAFVDSLPDISPLPTLRPIAEMSEKPPEGCVRVYSHRRPNGNYGAGDVRMAQDYLCADILLPVESPEDKMRAEFEEYSKGRGWTSLRLDDGRYRESFQECSWHTWKAAKSTP